MLEVGTARLKKNCVIKKIIAYKMMIILVLKKKESRMYTLSLKDLNVD